ncbi:hypothetical protein HK102_013350 [Quaeritorhiza haematococci]|nr:hypothetical protein HK102_013350 [Quaeritorhiza haematococci]
MSDAVMMDTTEDKLSMSLDDIIKTRKAQNKVKRGGGNASRGKGRAAAAATGGGSAVGPATGKTRTNQQQKDRKNAVVDLVKKRGSELRNQKFNQRRGIQTTETKPQTVVTTRPNPQPQGGRGGRGGRLTTGRGRGRGGAGNVATSRQPSAPAPARAAAPGIISVTIENDRAKIPKAPSAPAPRPNTASRSVAPKSGPSDSAPAPSIPGQGLSLSSRFSQLHQQVRSSVTSSPSQPSSSSSSAIIQPYHQTDAKRPAIRKL